LGKDTSLFQFGTTLGKKSKNRADKYQLDSEADKKSANS
jgi:hypothetical protein